MKKAQKLKLEMIRRGIISEVLERQGNQKLDTKTAFKFIENVNNLSHAELNELVVEATVRNENVATVVIEGLPLPL